MDVKENEENKRLNVRGERDLESAKCRQKTIDEKKNKNSNIIGKRMSGRSEE